MDIGHIGAYGNEVSSRNPNRGECMLLRVHLRRKSDISGVSGCGENVAAGVVFDDGSVVIRWNSTHPSIEMHTSIESLLWVHGHGNSTELVYDDPPVKSKPN
jgi:hypothetical protein